MKIPKSHGASEFKDLTITRVRAGHSARAVAMELRLIKQTLRNSGKVAAACTRNGVGGTVVTPEYRNYQDCEPGIRH